MSPNAKKALITVQGGVGVTLVMIGILTDAYGFWVGVIAAVPIWVVTIAVLIWPGESI
ncbi:hypothetical protein ACFLYB_02515 [Chloroflexota bacterium]